MLTPEEIEALKTPLKNMTPTLLALAVSARDKKTAIIEAENRKFKPKQYKKIYVSQDYEPFTSPVTGEVIGGRAQLREHLEKTGCRITEPSETRKRNELAARLSNQT